MSLRSIFIVLYVSHNLRHIYMLRSADDPVRTGAYTLLFWPNGAIGIVTYIEVYNSKAEALSIFAHHRPSKGSMLLA